MMLRFEDREVRGPVSLWLISRLEGERSKGQTWKAKKHECEDAKGHTWKGQRHRGSVWVMRQVIVIVRWAYTKKGGKKSEVSVWVMRQVTVRIEGQDALT
jgi:hypothetical protein